jgi:hypothetical protein
LSSILKEIVFTSILYTQNNILLTTYSPIATPSSNLVQNPSTAMDPRPTPKYVYRNGNILSFRISNTTGESETLSFQHSIDEIELHVLEKRFKAMKTQVEEKKAALVTRMKNHSLTSEEEEWLDNAGNLVNEFMLMERLKDIAPTGQHIAISPADVEIITKICMVEIPDSNRNTSEKKTVNTQSKKKERSTVASPKKKNIQNASASPKKKPSVKQKLNLKSASKSSKKPVQATLAQKIEVLDWHKNNGSNQTKTTKHFHAIYPEIGFKQPLISAWVADKD